MEKKTLSFKKSICNKKEKKERRRVFEVTEKKRFSLSLSWRLMDLEKGHSTGQMDKTMTNRGIMKICL